LAGVYDYLSAKVCDKVELKAIYTSDLSIAASHLDLPSIGLLKESENIAVVSRWAYR
jgi:2-methylisocitrate lyase-like PEP mutase family enzyme